LEAGLLFSETRAFFGVGAGKGVDFFEGKVAPEAFEEDGFFSGAGVDFFDGAGCGLALDAEDEGLAFAEAGALERTATEGRLGEGEFPVLALGLLETLAE
jgi:hypothetical protein